VVEFSIDKYSEARRVCDVRLGSDGTSGFYDIQDTEGVAVARLTLKYPGSW
jgi:hypothetical protein